MQADQSTTGASTYVAGSSNFRASDLQIAKLDENFAMAHKMGLAKINQSSAKTVGNPQYYLDESYYWNHATTTVKSSVDFTSKTKIPYNSNNTLYYIIKSNDYSCVISSVNEYGNADHNGNSWTETYENVTQNTCVERTPTIGMTYIYHQVYNLDIFDVLYSDGALSKLTTAALYTGILGRVPIGIVFATSTSFYDKTTMGWKHGYALSLQDVGSYKWWNSSSTFSQMMLRTEYIINTQQQILDDKDGYRNFQEMLAFAIAQNSDLSQYPALKAAQDYSGPASLSGMLIGHKWFIPSSGQWYDCWKNLGKATVAGNPISVSNINPSASNSSGINLSVNWDGISKLMYDNMRPKFEVLSNAGYTTSIPGVDAQDHVYWCASQHDASAIYEAFYDLPTSASRCDIYSHPSVERVWGVRCAIAF